MITINLKVNKDGTEVADLSLERLTLATHQIPYTTDENATAVYKTVNLFQSACNAYEEEVQQLKTLLHIEKDDNRQLMEDVESLASQAQRARREVEGVRVHARAMRSAEEKKRKELRDMLDHQKAAFKEMAKRRDYYMNECVTLRKQLSFTERRCNKVCRKYKDIKRMYWTLFDKVAADNAQQ